MKTKWNKVSGTFIVDLYKDSTWCVENTHNNDVFSGLIHNTELPQYLDTLEDPSYLFIEFKSSGYYDTGSMYGGADKLGWPPEGDDECIPVRAYIDNPKNLLSDDLMNELFEIFIEQIYEVELNHED